jgi:hypothetical protein
LQIFSLGGLNQTSVHWLLYHYSLWIHILC